MNPPNCDKCNSANTRIETEEYVSWSKRLNCMAHTDNVEILVCDNCHAERFLRYRPVEHSPRRTEKP